MDRAPRLRSRIVLAVVAGALLVALGVTLLLINTVHLRTSSEETTRGDTYLAAIINVERQVVDAETGLRGYVITGRTLFLAPTRTAQAALPAAVRQLASAASADGAFVSRARGLQDSAETYMTDYVPEVEGLVVHDPARARSFAITLAGKREVDAIRARTASLEALVAAREDARQRNARRVARHSTTEAVVVLVLLTILTLLLGALLGRLVISRERARRASEATTHTLRESLMPSLLPTVADCELAARFIPAGNGGLVGGDFYDVFALGPDRWGIVLGDVCGKGAEAAAVTAMARWTVRAAAAGWAGDPAEVLRFLNRTMLATDTGGRFITMIYMVLTVRGGEARLSVACAGHPPGIVVPAIGEPRPIEARGTLLGVWPDLELQTSELRLGPGDAIVLYTDGVSDPGPGPQRLPLQVLGDRPAGASAELLAERLESYSRQPAGLQRDDIAILVLRFRTASGGPALPPPDAPAGQAVVHEPSVV